MKTELFLVLTIFCLIQCQPKRSSFAYYERPEPIAPTLTIEERVHAAHIRGLYLCDDNIGWASGTGGTILKMLDGTHWTTINPKGYEHLDFRDIHGFNADNAVAMAAGDEGRIIRTSDGGTTWTEVYTNLTQGVFLDGMDFDGSKGYCIGDPIEGETFVLYSSDAGLTWTRLHLNNASKAFPKEGSYAASGTTVVYKDNSLKLVWSTDKSTRLISHNGGTSYLINEVPLRTGEGCGVFSIAFSTANCGVAVGGCYLDSLNTESNYSVTMNGGKTWSLAHADKGPRGYRSCVAYTPRRNFYVTCGRTGVDISYDYGYLWSPLSDEGYYTCALADSTGWLMGRGGKMAKLTW